MSQASPLVIVAELVLTPCITLCRAAFPDEQEFLYPPGTYLSVKEGSTRVRQTVQLTRQTSRGDMPGLAANVTIVDVEPSFPAL